MKYLSEINAFYDRLETDSLSKSAILLWHALMQTNNKCGWKENFSAPISVLALKSGLKERMISNARNELKTKGYIDFQSRKGNQSAIYKMISLSATIADNIADSIADNTSDKSADNIADNIAAFLDKTREEESIKKEEAKEPAENAYKFYESNFGIPSSFITDSIFQWIDDLSEEIVLAGMKLGLQKGARSFSYIETILKEWSSQQLTSIDQVRAYEESKKQKRNNTVPFRTREGAEKNTKVESLLERVRRGEFG
ncbi:DnaD domain protein [Alkalicoccobacillus plakortidis]|uniref:DnaD domain protein n=1 Tax=Alkalicoccobacillus plakortidis TaxID=444060 RepID=A0ABT0XDQ8_9BACI|nr:DnaD domain protein [Alkalicoccobacillus plakortidis]MCM2674060.1 DnaD domain protein [Alkalicoccobacillus plakortidis]